MTWGMPWLLDINQSSVFIDTFNLGINATNNILNESPKYKIIINGMIADDGDFISIEALDVYNISINGSVEDI